MRCYVPIVAGFAALGLSSGCIHYQDRPLSAADKARTLESRSLTNQALKSFLDKNQPREWTNWPHVEWDFEEERNTFLNCQA